MINFIKKLFGCHVHEYEYGTIDFPLILPGISQQFKTTKTTRKCACGLHEVQMASEYVDLSGLKNPAYPNWMPYENVKNTVYKPVGEVPPNATYW